MGRTRGTGGKGEGEGEGVVLSPLSHQRDDLDVADSDPVAATIAITVATTGIAPGALVSIGAARGVVCGTIHADKAGVSVALTAQLRLLQ